MIEDGIQWFSIGYNVAFWILLSIRIWIMRRKNVRVLSVYPRNRWKNILGLVAFFGILIIWSSVFIFSSFTTPGTFLLQGFWIPRDNLFITIIGMVLAICFQVLIWIAIWTMGKSWRIGMDDLQPDELVTRGIFRFSRNPIYLGMDGIAWAAFLIIPSAFFLIFASVMMISFHMQILKEEKLLGKIYGERYENYRTATPRYLIF